VKLACGSEMPRDDPWSRGTRDVGRAGREGRLYSRRQSRTLPQQKQIHAWVCAGQLTGQLRLYNTQELVDSGHVLLAAEWHQWLVMFLV
jgi:hypothetical protein